MRPDYIILETGLGGRLDATNAVEEPVLAVITSISLDHTQYLGNTIAAIAGEKAGIIKAGVPLIFDGSSEEASEVLKKEQRRSAAGVEKSRITRTNYGKLRINILHFPG